MGKENSDNGYKKIYPLLPGKSIPHNLITKLKVIRINQLWCSDITYIRILNGFVYLAAIIDTYSRRIVGCAIGKTLCPELTVTSLKMAIATRKTDNLIYL